MNIMRLRTLTTGILHTKIEHVYEDLEYITGIKGIMTHKLLDCIEAIRPWLKERVTDDQFWIKEYRPDERGNYPIPRMTLTEQKKYLGTSD